MSELTKTAVFCLAAVVLAGAAVTLDSSSRTPAIFDDQGEAFYPEFTDPLAPKSIEVIDYNPDTATATPLKVEFADNKWVVPSHHNYPADAEDRLAKTAAALMELKKDAIVGQSVEDHATYGVIDPVDEENPSLEGRGRRVTLLGDGGDVLADFIVGKEVEDKQGYRYMRVPKQRRVYSVKTDADVSSKFQDWIETDLLKLASGDVQKVVINSYSINERAGRLDNVERTELVKNSENQWRIPGGGRPQQAVMDKLAGALDNLRIVDVQPKPQSLSADLKARDGIPLTREAAVSLRQKGFILTQFGQLFSNEGEIIVETKNGLQYVLRFGEIASAGVGAATAEGEAEPGSAEADSGGERRWIFITVSYDEARAKKYAGDADPDSKGEDLATELRGRFAEWYYVISGADFGSLRPSRSTLLRG